MKRIKLNTKKIKKRVVNFLMLLAEKAFLTFFVLLIISLLFAGWIFYQYGFRVSNQESKANQTPVQFKEKTFNSVLDAWNAKEKKFGEAGTLEYSDPFYPSPATSPLTD